MKEQKFNISLTKTQLQPSGITGVYNFGVNIPDLALHKKFRIYIKEFIVISAVGVNHNMFQLRSNTLRFLNNWSSKEMINALNYNNFNLLNNGDILVSVISENPSYISTGSYEDSLEIMNPSGKHNIWVSDHTSTHIPIDTHEWYVNLVIIGYE